MKGETVYKLVRDVAHEGRDLLGLYAEEDDAVDSLWNEVEDSRFDTEPNVFHTDQEDHIISVELLDVTWYVETEEIQ